MKNFFACVVILGLIFSVCSAEVEGQKPPEFEIKTNSMNSNNVFIPGDTVRIEFRISGAKAGSDMKIEYKIVNFFDEVIMQDAKSVRGSSDGIFSETVDWVSGQNGVFDVWAKIISEDKEVKESHATFSVIPSYEKNVLLTDSPFGVTFGIPDLTGYSGIKWTRLDAYWDQIEHEKGKFDFSIMDSHLNEANRRGVELLAIIDYSASWASSAPQDVPSPERCMYPPKNIDDWKDYVTALVSHYKGRIKAWEIWNEVNAFDTFFKTGNPGKYVELLKAAYPIIKRIDPQTKVVGCVTSGIDVEFIEAVFKAGGFDYMDAVSVHPYRGTRGPEESNLEEDLLKVQRLIDKYGGGKRLWNTEFGWWANDFQPEYSRKGLALTEQEQANYLVRSYIIFLSSGFEKIFWFTHRHHVEDFAQSMDAGIGLLYHDYKMKPAAAAYRTMVDELEGAEHVSMQKIGDSIQTHLFRKEDKTDILAVWSWKDTGVVAVQSSGEYITLVDLMNNHKRLDVSKGPILIPLENGCPVFLEGKDVKILGQIIQIETAENILNPGKLFSVGVSLRNLLSGEIEGAIVPEMAGYMTVKPSAQSFVVKEGQSHVCRFQVEGSEKSEFGRKEISFILNMPGRLERQVRMSREIQIMPAYSVNLEDFEGDITQWKTNDKEAHVVYNIIDKSTDSVKEGSSSLHWKCKSPGRWNTITRDISNIDLAGARQIIFYLYIPHVQKGGEQGMGIEILEKDGSKYYHSRMIPLYPVGRWNIIIVNMEDFYLPSFSKDENNRLDPEQLQYLIFNLTAGEFEVYLDGLRVSKSTK